MTSITYQLAARSALITNAMLPNDNQLFVLRNALERHVVLPNKVWTRAIPYLRSSSFKARKYIVEAGEKVSDLHFMISGVVRHYYLSHRGKEFNKSFAVTGQIVSSFTSLLEGTPSPLYIQAIKPSECLSIAYCDFLYLSEHYHEWSILRTSILEEALIMKEQRETELLVLTAAERYVKFIGNNPVIAASIPNYHIASYLGITEVALSRIRRRLGLTVNRAATAD